MSTRALRTAASGLYAQQLNVEIISNNIANVNTTGFKKNKAEFQDLMYQEVSVNPLSTTTPGIKEANSSNIQVGNGVSPASSQKIFKQGDITATNNQFDLAIQGDGFFQLKRTDGSYAYSRDGSFQVNAEGKVVTASGYELDPSITLDPSVLSVAIAKDGQITGNTVGGGSENLGHLELVRFMNPAGLDAIGSNMYVETSASGSPLVGNPGANGYGEVNQGYLESSNVDIVEEMISMITAQRAYEINSKTVKTVEDMMTMANNLKGN
jgi:flagellar basal-body rod protein FlgG